MNIICRNCSKDSGTPQTGRNGIDAANAQDAGFIVKNLILYGIDQWVFVCSRECYQTVREQLFAEHGVTQETVAETKQFLDEQKAKIPAMAEEVCQKMAKLQKILQKKSL